MENAAFDRHRQFARQLRRKMQEIERDAEARAGQAEADDDEDYDFFAELDRKFSELYGSKNEDGGS